MLSHALRRELIAAAVLIVFGIWITGVALKIPLGVATDPLGPRTFPAALGVGIALCGVLLAGGVLFFRGRGAQIKLTMEPDPEDEGEAGGPFSPTRLIGVIGVTAVYLAAFEPLGYLPATVAYVLVLMLLHGGASAGSLAITPAIVTIVLYAVFKFALLVPVPPGVLAPLLPR
ncbi:MAG: tripartite tricarboxylate transporter TctB family protein [bacterium]